MHKDTRLSMIVNVKIEFDLIKKQEHEIKIFRISTSFVFNLWFFFFTVF
jgi:hypothetical protein